MISLGSKEDTDAAIKAAKNSFNSWKETSKAERIKLLEKLLENYKKRFDEILHKMKKIQPILVIGDVGVDKYTIGNVSIKTTKEPSKDKTFEIGDDFAI